MDALSANVNAHNMPIESKEMKAGDNLAYENNP